jgi:hypothetical protein
MTTAATPQTRAQSPVHYITVRVNNVDLFYREAGAQSAPVILRTHQDKCRCVLLTSRHRGGLGTSLTAYVRPLSVPVPTISPVLLIPYAASIVHPDFAGSN